MELPATNRPWNLIMFMAIPVILAEYIAVTELYVLFSRNVGSLWKKLNSVASVIVGFYFVGVFVYLLFNAVIPLTTSGGWRGPADVLAVGFYLSGVVPLFGLAMIELKGRLSEKGALQNLKAHASCVAVFLVVAHVAMIFGMLDPNVIDAATNVRMGH
jgi:hypothetical protein